MNNEPAALSNKIHHAFQAMADIWLAITPYRRAVAVVEWAKFQGYANTVTAGQLAAAVNTLYENQLVLISEYVKLILAIDMANQVAEVGIRAAYPALYRVTVDRADDPETNSDDILTRSQLIERYEYLDHFLPPPGTNFSFELVVDLTRISIKEVIRDHAV